MHHNNPFLETAELRHGLYGDSSRLARRTGALHAAKIRGRPVPEVLTELVPTGHDAGVVADVGCGRGSTTAYLAQHWAAATVTGFDQSSALLAEARRRLPAGIRAEFVCADFHTLPLQTSNVDVVVAAFCLYHAPDPGRVVAEFTRCLRPGGLAVLVTKSADSYQELDELVAAAGLDQHAPNRRSLYETFHSDNAEQIVANHLVVHEVLHHRHVFHYRDAEHAAHYLTTTPKYVLPPKQAVVEALEPLLDTTGVATTSTVSYLVAKRR